VLGHGGERDVHRSGHVTVDVLVELTHVDDASALDECTLQLGNADLND
jgi:hypothetical protein